MSKPTGYTITLLRAGDTSWDEEKRLVGTTDLPMTERGSDAVARAIYESNIDRPIATLLVSDEEAAISAARMLPRDNETKVRQIPELANVGLGLWEGVLWSDLEERNPSCFTQWRDSPERITPPEGESLVDAQERLLRAIEKSLSKVKGTNPHIAIVLRPIAWGTVRSWLLNETMSTIWDQLEQPVQIEQFYTSKAQLESRKQRSKANA